MQFNDFLTNILIRRNYKLSSKIKEIDKKNNQNFPAEEKVIEQEVEKNINNKKRSWGDLEKAIQEGYLKVICDTHDKKFNDEVLNEALEKSAHDISLYTIYNEKQTKEKLFNLVKRSSTYCSSKNRCFKFLKQAKEYIFVLCDHCGQENEDDWEICFNCEYPNNYL